MASYFDIEIEYRRCTLGYTLVTHFLGHVGGILHIMHIVYNCWAYASRDFVRKVYVDNVDDNLLNV